MIIFKFKLPETIFNPRCRQKYDTREEKRSEPHSLRILPRSWWPSSTSTTTPKARRLKAEALSKFESNNGKPGRIFLSCIQHSTSIVQLALSGDSGLLNTFLSGPFSCFESFVLFELFFSCFVFTGKLSFHPPLRHKMQHRNTENMNFKYITKLNDTILCKTL